MSSSNYTLIQTLPEYHRGSLGEVFLPALIEYKYHVYWVGLGIDNDWVLLSDEPYWNPNAVVSSLYTELANLARAEGKLATCAITPYALPEFNMGGTATLDQLKDMVDRSDYVFIDPYLISEYSDADQLLAFASMAIDYVRSVGKGIGLVMQGFAHPGLEEEVMAYNAMLADLDFDNIIIGDAIDFWDIPDEWQLPSVPLIGVSECIGM